MKNIDIIWLYSTMNGQKVEINGRIGTICGYRATNFIVGFNDLKGWTIPDNFDVIDKTFPSYGYISMYYFINKTKEFQNINNNKNNYITIIIIFGIIIFYLIHYFS
jgi:hypothetical protein